MRKMLLTCMLGLLLSGCGSLLRVQTSERQEIPAPPRESMKLKEAKQQTLQFARDTLDRVYVYGAEEGNEVVGAARDLCGILLSTEGAPAEPVEVPARISTEDVAQTQEDIEFLSEEISALHEDAEELKEDLIYYSAAHLEEVDGFEAEIRRLRNKELGVEESTEVRSDWLAWLSGIAGTVGIFGPIAIVALIIFVPGAATLIWTILGRARKGMGQLAAAAQDLLGDKDLDEKTRDKIRTRLHERMDEKTKSSFDKWGEKWRSRTTGLGP